MKKSKDMHVDKLKWMAAIPYLLILLIVINGNLLGDYDINVFGVHLSLITLIPYLIYHFVNRNHENDFIWAHTNRAMSLFIKYFILIVLFEILSSIMGFGMAIIDPVLLFTSGLIALALLLPFWLVVVYTIIAATIGSIRAFKLIFPNKEIFDPNEFDEIDTKI